MELPEVEVMRLQTQENNEDTEWMEGYVAEHNQLKDLALRLETRYAQGQSVKSRAWNKFTQDSKEYLIRTHVGIEAMIETSR
jgi:hemerythrin-like domain-containing protein